MLYNLVCNHTVKWLTNSTVGIQFFNHKYDHRQNWTVNATSCYQLIINITISIKTVIVNMKTKNVENRLKNSWVSLKAFTIDKTPQLRPVGLNDQHLRSHGKIGDWTVYTKSIAWMIISNNKIGGFGWEDLRWMAHVTVQ